VKFGLPIVLCLLALLGVAQAAPLLPADPRAAKAVQDYLRQQKEEQGRDQDERVAARIGALADNPASPVLATSKPRVA